MLFLLQEQRLPDMKVLSNSELSIIPGANLFNGLPNTDMLALELVRVCYQSESLSTEIRVTSLSTGVCVSSLNTGVCVISLSTGVCVISLSTEACVTVMVFVVHVRADYHYLLECR